MRYFIDCEFIEHPITICLISIGMVAEDGREYYAECAGVDWHMADAWIYANVEPHLVGPVVPRPDIKDAIVEFVGQDDSPEFWGYYCAYDWVAFCWLFGRMIDLPVGWPKLCRDIKHWAIDLGSPKLPEQTGPQHHALADARWNKQAWQFLSDYAAQSGTS